MTLQDDDQVQRFMDLLPSSFNPYYLPYDYTAPLSVSDGTSASASAAFFSSRSISSSSYTTAEVPFDTERSPEFDSSSLSVIPNDPNELLSGIGLDYCTAVPPLLNDSTDLLPADDTFMLFSNTAPNSFPCSDPSHILFGHRRLEPDDVAAAVNELLPQLDPAQLDHMSNILRDIQLRIRSMLQAKCVPGERQSVTNGSYSAFRAHYFCKLCERGAGKVYASLGSFKRHVCGEHEHPYQYSCVYRPDCSWFSYRKDKVHDHVRNRHGILKPLKACDFGSLRLPNPPPQYCTLCMVPVNTWDEFFRCVSSHCRLSGEREHTLGSGSERTDNDG